MTAAVMNAMLLPAFGEPEVLRPAELPVPRPGAGEVLVRVRAVSVGRTLDVATRAGRPPFASALRLPHVLGADHAGEVAEVGPGVTGFAPGDRVAAFPVLSCGRCRGCVEGRTETCPELRLLGVHRPGGYAEYCVVPAANLAPLPASVPDRQAAALALNGAVAVRQLADAGLAAGDWLLVHAAAGALGSAVLSLAVHRGLRVVAAARQPHKHGWLRELGADLVVDPLDAGFTDRVRSVTGGDGVRAVVDNVADPALWTDLPDVLAAGGTVVCSGALGAAQVQLDLRRFYLRSQTLRAVRTARPADVLTLWAEVAAGYRVPLDEKVFDLADAAAAHHRVESNDSLGRVVLGVG
jgi:NADPH:quinone reductase-like Zn-dependent oxidoreductase